VKNIALLSAIMAFGLSTSVVAEGELKASESELDMLSGEASETVMKDENTDTPVVAEPEVTPIANTDVDALSESVAKQLSDILGAADASDEKQTDSKLEGMVSSALLNGANMDDLRTAVDAAMKDLATSEQRGVAANKVKQAEETLKKLVGKADNDYLKQPDNKASEYSNSLKPEKSKSGTVTITRTASSNISDAVETVIVQPGESLYKIALRVYGSGDNFVRLYEANKNSIVDPNLIRVGQILRVPR